jgi:hypothetical protein
MPRRIGMTSGRFQKISKERADQVLSFVIWYCHTRAKLVPLHWSFGVEILPSYSPALLLRDWAICVFFGKSLPASERSLSPCRLRTDPADGEKRTGWEDHRARLAPFRSDNLGNHMGKDLREIPDLLRHKNIRHDRALYPCRIR